MAVLVTGGAGFIGSNLVDELMAMGHEVDVLDDLSEGNMGNILRWKSHQKFRFVRGDVRDFDLVKRLADRKSCIFHLAAMSRIQPSITDPIAAWSANVVGTGNVLEAARLGDVPRVVYSASSSAYGEINKPPMNEKMPTDCLNPYSLSKKTGEDMCALYSKLYGISTVSLRYFNVYGPRHQEEGSYATVIAIFRKQARLGQPLTIVGDGEQRRDFTFVGDVVRANMMAMMNREVGGVVNIGTGENHSINDVAEAVISMNGSGVTVNIPARLGEARVTLADRSLASKALGWSPRVTFKQGLAVLDEFERKNPPVGRIVLP